MTDFLVQYAHVPNIVPPTEFHELIDIFLDSQPDEPLAKFARGDELYFILPYLPQKQTFKIRVQAHAQHPFHATTFSLSGVSDNMRYLSSTRTPHQARILDCIEGDLLAFAPCVGDDAAEVTNDLMQSLGTMAFLVSSFDPAMGVDRMVSGGGGHGRSSGLQSSVKLPTAGKKAKLNSVVAVSGGQKAGYAASRGSTAPRMQRSYTYRLITKLKAYFGTAASYQIKGVLPADFLAGANGMNNGGDNDSADEEDDDDASADNGRKRKAGEADADVKPKRERREQADADDGPPLKLTDDGVLDLT